MNCFALIIISAGWQLDEVCTALECCYHSFTLALGWCNDILTTSAGQHQPGRDGWYPGWRGDHNIVTLITHRMSAERPDDIFIVSSSVHDGKMVTENKMISHSHKWDNLLVSPGCLHLTGPENDNVETLDKWSATVNYCPTPQLLQTGGGPRRQLVICANVCSSHIPIIIKNQSRSSNQPVRVITLSNLKCVVASSVGSRLKFYQTVGK